MQHSSNIPNETKTRNCTSLTQNVSKYQVPGRVWLAAENTRPRFAPGKRFNKTFYKKNTAIQASPRPYSFKSFLCFLATLSGYSQACLGPHTAQCVRNDFDHYAAQTERARSCEG